MTWPQNVEPVDNDPASQGLPVSQPVMVSGPKLQPLVTYGLLGITILLFFGQVITGGYISYGTDFFTFWGAKINTAITYGQIWRLFTPMFLHGSSLHLVFNMYALYILGRNLEPTYGHWRFLLLYLVSGFAGNVFSFVMTPAASLGASTAIFGLIGAEGIFWYQNRRLFGNTAQRVLYNIVFIAAINLFIGLSPMIDNWGHIGGLFGGLLFAWFAGPNLVVKGFYPAFYLADQRGGRHIWGTVAGVGLLFSSIAFVVILLRL